MAEVDAAQFLNPLPPDDDALLAALLVDRERELDQARLQMLAIRSSGLRRPVAVIGSARVGKSHLLRHLGAQLTETGEFSLVVPLYLTSGLTSSIAVLRELWNQTYAALHRAVLEQGLGDEPGHHALAELDAMLNVYGPAVAGEATRVQVTRARAVTTSIEATFGLSLPTLVSRLGPIEATLGSTTALQSSDEHTVEMAPFDESALTDLVALAHFMVRDAEPDRGWTTLLVLDDVDLLRRDADGGFDPDELVQALGTLARVEGLYVMCTLRRDTYARHSKVFHLGAELGPFVEDGHLVEIYERHVEVFGAGERAFADAFVAELARRSTGRVGVFLANLRRAWLADPGAASVADFVRTGFARLESEEPELARVLRQAARTGGRVAGDDLVRLRNSVAFEYILEDTTSENAARVEPVLRSVLGEPADGV